MLLMRCDLQMRMILRSNGQNSAAMIVGPIYTAKNSMPLKMPAYTSIKRSMPYSKRPKTKHIHTVIDKTFAFFKRNSA